MYHKAVGGAAGVSGILPTTGMSWMFTLLTFFVLLSVGAAMVRLIPRWKLAHADTGFPVRVTRRNTG